MSLLNSFWKCRCGAIVAVNAGWHLCPSQQIAPPQVPGVVPPQRGLRDFTVACLNDAMKQGAPLRTRLTSLFFGLLGAVALSSAKKQPTEDHDAQDSGPKS